MSTFRALALAAAPAEKLSLEQIVKRQHSIIKRLDENRVHDLNADQSEALRVQQRQVFTLIEGKGSRDQLSKADSRQLDKSREAISNLLTSGRAELEKCRQERSIGTRVGQPRCGKQADRQTADRRAREWRDRNTPLQAIIGAAPRAVLPRRGRCGQV